MHIIFGQPPRLIFATLLRPLDSELDSACKYVKRFQEVLVYVTDTCPSLTKPGEKLVAVTPLNKNKKVRVTKPATSSNNTQKQVDSHKTQDSNKPVLPSIGMKSSTSASRSQPSSNTKNNRISQPTNNNPKNKVEVQPRNVKSKSNKKNHVIELVCNANVKHTSLNANSKLICVKCNQCMFDANHDVCFLEFVNDVNVQSKSKSAKRSKKKKTWKPTGKVFTDIGYRWKPTGRTFTIVGNSCPLTRFTSTKVEPLKETTLKSVTTTKPEIKIYCRKTKVAKSEDLNNSCPDCSLVFGLWMLQAYDRKPLSAHQLCSQISGYCQIRKLDLSYLHVFGALCCPTNDSEDLSKLKPKADIEIFVGYALAKKAYRIYNKRTRYVDYTLQIHNRTYLSSTTIDQDAPSTSSSQTPQESQSPVIPSGVEEYFHNIDVEHLDNDPFFGASIPEPNSEESSLRDIIPSNNYKEALKESCWIEAIQEELNKFECLEVWELVPRPDRVMIITLKWIFKVKLDELGGVLKNKARLVERGYHQEERIEFEESFPLDDTYRRGDSWNEKDKKQQKKSPNKETKAKCGK
ncbi:retrovirus-related pol polyprotein from transposon TNT 1-94 [Tanacetum coccineum]